jgi:SAM-dependent methyltransferase
MADSDAREPTGRFTNRAEDYVRYRPSYPAAAVDAVLEGLGPPATLVAADIGAGTGISARLLADRGVEVIAVEPNRAMREAAAPHAAVTFRDGSAEAIPLADGAVDLVVAAQAYHWFRADEAVREMARALKSGGRLALLWNRRAAVGALMQGYERALLEAADDPAVVGMHADLEAVDRSRLFRSRRILRFEQRQAVDRDGLLGRALSASYVPKHGPRLVRLVERLTALYDQYAAGGSVDLVYETEVTLAERLPR